MTREQIKNIIKLLNSRKTSKEQLREALADLAGVPYVPHAKLAGEKVRSLFALCQSEFMRVYLEEAKVKYSFGVRDGKALKDIINKIGDMEGINEEQSIYMTFCALVQNLPQWYKENAFSLPRINGNFNAIIASIRNGEKTGITSDYKQRTINDLRSR